MLLIRRTESILFDSYSQVHYPGGCARPGRRSLSALPIGGSIEGVKTIRAFIAIPLPAAVTATLAKSGQSLARQLPPNSVRWVKPEAMHLTLRFLGDTAENQLPALKQGLDEICGRYAPFELQLGELGCFPNPRRPRVIWGGLKELSAEGGLCRRLAAEIEGMVVGLGWQAEGKAFRPHLTIGRVREGQRLPEVAWGQALEPLTFAVTAVHLIESQLRPSGPLYTTLHSSSLLR